MVLLVLIGIVWSHGITCHDWHSMVSWFCLSCLQSVVSCIACDVYRVWSHVLLVMFTECGLMLLLVIFTECGLMGLLVMFCIVWSHEIACHIWYSVVSWDCLSYLT
jgi:hypothetical protein